MRKVALAIAIVFVFTAGPACADYVNPPGWNTNAYFTHQSWDFNTNANPTVPDGGYFNPYGTPIATLAGSWQNSLDPWYATGRQGGWLFSGPKTMATQLATATIPNIAVPNLTKEIWLQATFATNNPDPNDLALYFTVGGGPITPTSMVLTPLNAYGLTRVTLGFSIFPQPASETLVFSAALDAGQYVLIDQLDVDTRCVPEPGTISMLIAGAFALAGWAVRRRS